ncbi:MAG: hypothetical protein P1U77_21815 [Rubripirellula sp.]|jgi:hypothetical protein|nr:hypothetical protein [Rubripirellula sp.]
MKLDLRAIQCIWINVDTDIEKAAQMESLLDRLQIKRRRRFSGITGIAPHAEVNYGEEHYRNCAESHFAVLRTALKDDTFPLLILEDDVEAQGFPDEPIEFPSDADAIYLGTSHGNRDYLAIPVSDHLLRIERVFAAHAVIYLSRSYAEAVIADGLRSIYEHDEPFDVAVAFETQPRFCIYGMRKPIFYQSDAKNQTNKWEQMTRTPLSPRNKTETDSHSLSI